MKWEVWHSAFSVVNASPKICCTHYDPGLKTLPCAHTTSEYMNKDIALFNEIDIISKRVSTMYKHVITRQVTAKSVSIA
jgi:hypothetical protein